MESELASVSAVPARPRRGSSVAGSLASAVGTRNLHALLHLFFAERKLPGVCVSPSCTENPVS